MEYAEIKKVLKKLKAKEIGPSGCFQLPKTFRSEQLYNAFKKTDKGTKKQRRFWGYDFGDGEGLFYGIELSDGTMIGYTDENKILGIS